MKNDRPRKYWSDLKKKLEKEGSQLSEKIGQLKMKAPDGKFYEGGKVAKVALQELEAQTGKKVVTSLNSKGVLEATERKKIE